VDVFYGQPLGKGGRETNIFFQLRRVSSLIMYILNSDVDHGSGVARISQRGVAEFASSGLRPQPPEAGGLEARR